MKKYICKSLLKFVGWKVTGVYPYEVRRKILAVGPHTSNWDFPLGILVRGSLNDKIKYVGKSALFKPPLGWIMRWLGGVPVDRSKSNNFVDGVVKLFDEHKELSILFAPEGTRKKVKKLKTGFYHIAKLSNVPILPVVLDYKKKEFRFMPLFFPTKNTESDILEIENTFRGVQGYYPEKSF